MRQAAKAVVCRGGGTVSTLRVSKLVNRHELAGLPRGGTGSTLRGGEQARMLHVVSQRERLAKRTNKRLLLLTNGEGAGRPSNLRRFLRSVGCLRRREHSPRREASEHAPNASQSPLCPPRATAVGDNCRDGSHPAAGWGEETTS